MDGELRAAREIQMGMLPDPRAIEGLPRTIDFYALLEPAQEVGGDLYDAFMLDEHRLFFMIGDVSGKGVPASLFMALTKTLTKSLARREKVVGAIAALGQRRDFSGKPGGDVCDGDHRHHRRALRRRGAMQRRPQCADFVAIDGVAVGNSTAPADRRFVWMKSFLTRSSG